LLFMTPTHPMPTSRAFEIAVRIAVSATATPSALLPSMSAVAGPSLTTEGRADGTCVPASIPAWMRGTRMTPCDANP
jgi:hypothetical protein